LPDAQSLQLGIRKITGPAVQDRMFEKALRYAFGSEQPLDFDTKLFVIAACFVQERSELLGRERQGILEYPPDLLEPFTVHDCVRNILNLPAAFLQTALTR
jgi:hypothetical protein